MLKGNINYDKELLKMQKRGLYNPKIKFFAGMAVCLLITFIASSFALFEYNSGISIAYRSKINKYLTVDVTAINGSIGSLSNELISRESIKTNPNLNSTHTDKGLYLINNSQKTNNGKPVYYYRGEVTNNYVSFADGMWRIVRINEDGSIRIIQDGESMQSNYSNSTSPSYNSSLVKSKIDSWYNSLSTTNKNFLTTAKFCNGTNGSQITSRYNSKNFAFKCLDDTQELELNAGILSGDEIVYAGAKLRGYSPTYLNTSNWYWTMTSADSSNMYIGLNNGLWNHTSPMSGTSRGIKVVVNLKPNIKIASGDGSKSNPFTLATGNTSITEKILYNDTKKYYVAPSDGYVFDKVECTNKQTATYDASTNILTIDGKDDSTCTVNFVKQTFANKILADNTLKTQTPDFSVGAPPSTVDSSEVPNVNTNGLFKTQDDDGDSYYFRGAITNNYVSFAGYTWRIVRINGDNSVRLILNNKTDKTSKFNSNIYNIKYVGYTYNNASACTISSPCISTYNKSTKKFTNNKTVTNSTMKQYLENTWYQNIADYDDYIAQSGFCNDTSFTTSGSTKYFSVYYRTSEKKMPSLKCSNTQETYGGYYESKIGLINADEVTFAGLNGSNENNYLYIEKNSNIWTMSTGNSTSSSNARIYTLWNSGFQNNNVWLEYYTRPVINLRSDLSVTSGNGTENDPYVVSLD